MEEHGGDAGGGSGASDGDALAAVFEGQRVHGHGDGEGRPSD